MKRHYFHLGMVKVTTFKYSNLKISSPWQGLADDVKVSADITNTWNREGEEIVQLYYKDMVSSLTPMKPS